MSVDARLAELGLILPPTTPHRAEYVPVTIHAKLAFVSGQIPRVGADVPVSGKLGAEVDLATGQQSARLCTLNALAQLREVLGSLDEVQRILKVTGFVASAPGFNNQPEVINAASNLLTELFGEAGCHARSAIGVCELPRGAPVEIELIVSVK